MLTQRCSGCAVMSYLLQRVSARHLSRQLLGSLEALGHAVAASPELHEEVLRRLVRHPRPP